MPFPFRHRPAQAPAAVAAGPQQQRTDDRLIEQDLNVCLPPQAIAAVALVFEPRVRLHAGDLLAPTPSDRECRRKGHRERRRPARATRTFAGSGRPMS